MAGRRNLYEAKVKSRFKEIAKWIAEGTTERQVATKLGIAYPTFNKYKQEHEELVKLLDDSKLTLEEELRGILIKKARGFTYNEKKTYDKVDELTGAKTTYVEITEKYAQPDVAAANLLLKNISKTWLNDPATHKLRERELELREKMAAKNMPF